MRKFYDLFFLYLEAAKNEAYYLERAAEARRNKEQLKAALTDTVVELCPKDFASARDLLKDINIV